MHRVIRPRVFLLSIVGKMLRAWNIPRAPFFLDVYLELGLLDHVIVEFVLCARIAKLFPRATVPL